MTIPQAFIYAGKEQEASKFFPGKNVKKFGGDYLAAAAFLKAKMGE
jgi:hypothetical protein